MFNTIPNELSCYFLKKNSIFLSLFISCLRGWGLFNLNSKCVLTSKYSLLNYSFTYATKGYFICLSVYCLGFYRNYFHYIKLKGMGFKAILIKKQLLFKLGYSHRIIVHIKTNVKFWYIAKQVFRIESRDFSTLKQFIFSVFNFRKVGVYKKKGLYLKGSLIKLKLSSKKSKF